MWERQEGRRENVALPTFVDQIAMTKRGVRTKVERYVHVPLEVEYPLMALFGESMHHIAGGYPDKYWRTTLNRILLGLRKYVRTNLETDPAHEKQIYELFDRMIEQAKRDDYETLVVACLVELCVLLLGDRPSYLWQKKLNKQWFFKLNRYRTLQYGRTAAQKARLIRDSWIKPRIKEEEEKDQYDGEGHRREKTLVRYARQSNLHEFLEQFRKSYPEDFVKLFC